MTKIKNIVIYVSSIVVLGTAVGYITSNKKQNKVRKYNKLPQRHYTRIK